MDPQPKDKGRLIPDLSTRENREFWAFVDRVATEVRLRREYHICCEKACLHGEGGQTCMDVRRAARLRWKRISKRKATT